MTKWLSRFKPDPLRRLHLDGVRTGGGAAGAAVDARVSRSSIPTPTPVQRARVDTAVRAVADTVAQGMARPWANAIRTASLSRLDDFSDALDQAVARTDLGVRRDPFWWNAVRVLQWVLFLTAVVGGLWLAALAFFAYLRLPQPGDVDWQGFPLPTLLLIGGVVAGVLVAALSRLAAKLSARRRAARAHARLRAAIERVTDEAVIEPMRAEIDAYARCRDGVRAALR